MDELFDIGTLKNDPVGLHYLAQILDPLDIGACGFWDINSECYKVLRKICDSLWASMPPVVVYDYRDPNDPSTWGDFGAPPGITSQTDSDLA